MQKIIYVLAIILSFTCRVNAQCGKYLMLNSNPWGQTSDQNAMNTAFGAGNWTQVNYSSSAAAIFSPSNCFVMMEGSEIGNPTALNNYLAANITTIQNWVNNGGRLFINAAPNEGGSINCGFSGTIINYATGPYSGNALAVNSGDAIFQGPSTPVGTSYTGGYFAHASVIGSGLTNLLTGNTPSASGTVILAYKKWGSGVVFIGTLTQPPFWSPQPQATNLWTNIFSYVNAIPTVTISCSVGISNFCSAVSTLVQVNYTATGTFQAGNVFTAQLSSAGGSFSSFNNIGSVTAVSSGIINAVIPSGIAVGTGYRIRVVGSLPSATGSDNGSNIESMAGISGSASATPVTCFGGNNGTAQITLSSSTSGTYTLDGGSAIAYNSNPFTITGLLAGNHTIIATPASGCVSSLIGAFVGSPAQLTGTGTTTPTTCGNSSNGSAQITLSASTAGTYTIDGGSSAAYSTNPFTINGLAAGNHTVVAITNSGCVSSNILINVGGSTAFTATANHTNLSQCSGLPDGTITVTPAGGTGSYTYSWTGETGSNHTLFTAGNFSSLTGLNYGYYTVTITDAGGCGIVTLSNIHVEIGYQVTITNSGSNSSSCSNIGSLILFGNSGLTPYTWSMTSATGPWQVNNTFSGLAAGTYTVWVKDNGGCVNSKSVSVGSAPAIVVSSNVVNASSCGNDGSIQIFRTGGIPGYTYSLTSATGPWQTSNFYPGLAPGSYTAYVKDAAGCVGQQSVTVLAGAGVVVNVSKVNTSTCVNDGSIQVNPSGGIAPYTYSKDGGTTYQAGNSFTGLSQGNYAVVLKDSRGCSGSLNVTINLNSINVTASVVNASGCAANNGKITLFRTGGYGPYTYSIDGNNYQASNLFTNVAAGTYTGYVKDAKFCIGVSADIVVGPTGCHPTFTKGITATNNAKIISVASQPELQIQAYPNPGRSEFTLILQSYDSKAKVTVTVTDLLGRKVYQAEGIGRQQYKFGAGFIAGTYNVQVIQGTEKKNLTLVKE